MKDILLFRQPCRRFLLKLSRYLPERYRDWLLDELYPSNMVVRIEGPRCGGEGTTCEGFMAGQAGGGGGPGTSIEAMERDGLYTQRAADPAGSYERRGVRWPI